MADNSAGGQYQVADPMGNTPDDSPQVQVAPTPSGQMPPQQSAPEPTPVAAPVSNPNAPDASSPNPGPQRGQQPDPQNQNQTPQQGPTPAQSRTQKFISRAREISSEITGGDPYKTTIDPVTGVTTRTRQPLSPRALSLSLVLEALQGGLAGAGAHGPNAIGQAAQAGLKQGEQIADQRQQAQAQQDQQAQTDLKTRQQVITNMLQTRLLAQNLGKQSYEQAQQSVAAFADKWKQHQDDPTSIIAQDLSHDDAYAALAKQGYGNAEVEITGVRPRTDITGAPVYQLPNGQIVSEDTPGAYQAPDFSYALVKPTAKVSITDADGNLNADYRKAASRGFVAANDNGKYPPNFQMTSVDSQAALRGSQNADAIQAEANTARASMGLPSINIDGDLKANSNVRNAMTMYSSALNKANSDGVPNPHQVAYNAVANSQWASAAGTIQNWFGGADATKRLDAQHSAQEFNSGVLNGSIKLDNPQTITSARLSNDPKVKAAGDAQYQKNEQDALELDRRKQQQDENIRVGGVIAETKARALLNSEDPAVIQSTAQQLVDGNIDPTQLSKKSKTYDAQLAAANQYSMSHFGVPFDIEKAQRDYKYASNTQTINTLNFLSSIVASGQTVLDKQKAVGNITSFPSLNDTVQWAKLERGNPAVAGYHTALTEYSDQVAKILQGGGTGSGTSDAKLKQAQELFKQGYNQAQMAEAISTAGALLGNRKQSMVGNNRYLLRDTMPKPTHYGQKLTDPNVWSQYLKAYGTPQAADAAAKQQGWQ